MPLINKRNMYPVFIGIVVTCLLIFGLAEMVHAGDGQNDVQNNTTSQARDYTVMTPDGPVTIRNVTPDQTGDPCIIYFYEA